MNKIIKIFGLSGSLRKGSYNSAFLQAGLSVLPKNADLEIFEDLAAIPPFDQDFEKSLPVSVVVLKQKIRESDAVLFATPEYNYSFPGVLKNAIDWASRPYGDNAWEGKPVAMMSASSGMLGGSRAQYQLRQVFVFLNMHPLNHPEVIIPKAQEKVDENGRITDDHTQEKIRELLEALIAWTIELREGKHAIKEMKEKDEYEKSYGRIYHL